MEQARVGVGPLELGGGGEIERRVVANRSVWAAAGLDAHDASRVDHAIERAPHMFSILLGVDNVGDNQWCVAGGQQHWHQALDQRRFAAANRPADTAPRYAPRMHVCRKWVGVLMVMGMQIQGSLLSKGQSGQWSAAPRGE